LGSALFFSYFNIHPESFSWPFVFLLRLSLAACAAGVIYFACPKYIKQEGQIRHCVLIYPASRRTRHAVPMVRTVTQTGGSIRTTLFI